MRKYLSPFILIFTAFIGLAYAYARYQLSPIFATDLLLAIPFISIWLLPILFWTGEKSEMKPWAHSLQMLAYFSMAFLNFVFVALIPLNVLALILEFTGQIELSEQVHLITMPLTFAIAIICLIVGYLRATNGPSIRELNIPLESIRSHSPLNDLRIVQISDLHVGPTIHKNYVEHVVRKSNELHADLVVLTGDIVDGNLKDLQEHVEPLRNLKADLGVFLILGNHDYYSGAKVWVKHFESLGMRVLLNSHVRIAKGGEEFLLAGVLDPAVQGFFPAEKPDPFLARGNVEQSSDILRILLAHNPKLAPEASRAGFHLQLSGHTHAGQFIPWTWVTKLVHRPHYLGLSNEGSMRVFVSAGTGSWGPPIRLGTSPEISALTLSAKSN